MRRLAPLPALALAFALAPQAGADPNQRPGEFTGKTAQRRAVSMHLTRSGTALVRGEVRWRAVCAGGRRDSGVLLLPRMAIRPGGVVVARLPGGSFFRGRFSKPWALSGTFRVVTAAGCRTAVLRWSAQTCVRGPRPRFVRRLLL